MREFSFESHGTDLFCVEAGEGTPIVLLHGGLATHLACRVFAAPLDAHHRVVTPDLRGAGRSIFHGELSWKLLADDVAALVHALGVQRAVIGGVSFGAAVATAAALHHPEIVERLVILSPAYGGTELGLSDAQQAAMQAMDACGRRAPDEGIEVLLPLFANLPEAIRERATKLVAGYDPRSVATTTRFMASLAQPFERGTDLQRIVAPTLLVPGMDATHPHAVADVYRAHLENCVTRSADSTRYTDEIAAFVGTDERECHAQRSTRAAPRGGG
jgi:pimeloyl-ACP methyl ester carboxylesterase